MKKEILFEISQDDWKSKIGDEYRQIEPSISKKYKIDKKSKLSDLDNSFTFNRELQRKRKNWWMKHADQNYFNSKTNENVVTLHGISTYGYTEMYKTYEDLKKDYDVFYNPTKIMKNEQSTIGIIVNKMKNTFTPDMAFDALIDNNLIKHGLGDILLHFWPRRITNASKFDNWSETFGFYKSLNKNPQTIGDWYKNNPKALKLINDLKKKIDDVKNDDKLNEKQKENKLNYLEKQLKNEIKKQSTERQQKFNYFDLTKGSGTRKNPISYLHSTPLENDEKEIEKFENSAIGMDNIRSTKSQSILKPSEIDKKQEKFGEVLVGNAKIKNVFSKIPFKILSIFINSILDNNVIDDIQKDEKDNIKNRFDNIKDNENISNMSYVNNVDLKYFNINGFRLYIHNLYDAIFKIKYFHEYNIPCFDLNGVKLNELFDGFVFKSTLEKEKINENILRKLIRSYI
jgi:hypothetical protein